MATHRADRRGEGQSVHREDAAAQSTMVRRCRPIHPASHPASQALASRHDRGAPSSGTTGLARPEPPLTFPKNLPVARFGGRLHRAHDPRQTQQPLAAIPTPDSVEHQTRPKPHHLRTERVSSLKPPRTQHGNQPHSPRLISRRSSLGRDPPPAVRLRGLLEWPSSVFSPSSHRGSPCRVYADQRGDLDERPARTAANDVASLRYHDETPHFRREGLNAVAFGRSIGERIRAVSYVNEPRLVAGEITLPPRAKGGVDPLRLFRVSGERCHLAFSARP